MCVQHIYNTCSLNAMEGCQKMIFTSGYFGSELIEVGE